MQVKMEMARDMILWHLRHIGPATTRELVDETGKCRDAVRKAVNRLREDGSVFIKDWPYTGVQRAKLWALRTSGQKDAPKPPARPLTELKVEWGRRNKTLLKARRSAHAARGNPFAMLIR